MIPNKTNASHSEARSEEESPYFPTHTVETAPPEGRGMLEETAARFGFLPKPVARHATAPAVVEGFSVLHSIFENTSLAPLEREAVALVLAGKFDCVLCRGLHTGIAKRLGAPEHVVTALISGTAVDDPRLAALARFTARVVDVRGAIVDAELEEFVAAGFTPRQALEVVVGIATYTLSIFANRMTRSESMR